MHKLYDDRANSSCDYIQGPARRRACDLVQLSETNGQPFHDKLAGKRKVLVHPCIGREQKSVPFASGSKGRTPRRSELPESVLQERTKEIGAQTNLGGTVEAKRLAAVGEHDDNGCVPDCPFGRDSGHVHVVNTAPANVGQVSLHCRKVERLVKLLIRKL